MPVAMLYVNGIMITVKNAGTATSNSFQLISPKFDTIRAPTVIKAGAVTAGVTTANNGEKNSATKKNAAVTIAVNPERPPAATQP